MASGCGTSEDSQGSVSPFPRYLLVPVILGQDTRISCCTLVRAAGGVDGLSSLAHGLLRDGHGDRTVL